VLFPEPVGPVTRSIPCGKEIICRMLSAKAAGKPKFTKFKIGAEASKSRMTTFSPY
jgi:hypothetical protein